MRKFDLSILTDLHVVSTSEYEKVSFECHLSTYIVTYWGRVTYRGGFGWDDWIYYTYTLVTTSNTALPLISTLYSSLLQTQVPTVNYSLHSSFPGNGFNTGTIRVSLNYTLQISLYYCTCKVFSSLPDFQLSTELARLLQRLPSANSGTLNPILCCNCHLFSLIFAELTSRLHCTH
jgi:hypothetical protein